MSKVYEPRDYAPFVSDHIARNRRCAVWAPPGFGKTVMTLSVLDALDSIEDVWPALVIAPLRVARDVWPEEPLKWNHLQHIGVSPLIGLEGDRRRGLDVPAHVYTINPENIPWLVKIHRHAWPYRTVVVDEATKLKSLRVSFQKHPKSGKEYLTGQGGVRAKALAQVAREFKRVIELTGTPSPNGLQDLWGQLWFLDAGRRLGRTYTAFRKRFFQTDQYSGEVTPLPFAREQIEGLVKDICLSLQVADWFDVEEPYVNNVYVKLPASARSVYRELEKEMFVQLAEGEVEAVNAAALTQKCLQLANGAAYLGEPGPGERKWATVHDEKLDALESLVEEAGGAPQLVMYEFKSDAARIKQRFGKHVADLGTAAGLAQFKKGRTAIGLGHPKSVGHGIDGLQYVCNIVDTMAHAVRVPEADGRAP